MVTASHVFFRRAGIAVNYVFERRPSACFELFPGHASHEKGLQIQKNKRRYIGQQPGTKSVSSR